MGNLDLGTLIVAGIAGLGLIQLSLWVVLMIRHWGDEVLYQLPVESASIQPHSKAGLTLPEQR
jgi:hypothetical protein